MFVGKEQSLSSVVGTPTSTPAGRRLECSVLRVYEVHRKIVNVVNSAHIPKI